MSRALAHFFCVALMVATVATAQPVEQTRVKSVRIPDTVIECELVRVERDGKPVLWVGRTEVSWDLYDVYLYGLDIPEGTEADAVTRPSKPYVPPDRGMGHAGYPAMGMTRQAAESFCEWFSQRTGLVARLPKPAEFTAYAAIDQDAALVDHAWTAANSDNNTLPIGSLEANALGLHDTLGNVAEWVATEGKPVAMGGSYRDTDDRCTPQTVQQQARSWNRSDPQIPKSQWWLADCSWVGFRFVVEEPADEQIEQPIQQPTDQPTEQPASR